MFKVLAGLTVGVLLTLGGLYGTALYLTSPKAQLNRCMNLYLDGEAGEALRNDEAIKELLSQENTTLEALVESRCRTWIGNGQRF